MHNIYTFIYYFIHRIANEIDEPELYDIECRRSLEYNLCLYRGIQTYNGDRVSLFNFPL